MLFTVFVVCTGLMVSLAAEVTLVPFKSVWTVTPSLTLGSSRTISSFCGSSDVPNEFRISKVVGVELPQDKEWMIIVVSSGVAQFGAEFRLGEDAPLLFAGSGYSIPPNSLVYALAISVTLQLESCMGSFDVMVTAVERESGLSRGLQAATATATQPGSPSQTGSPSSTPASTSSTPSTSPSPATQSISVSPASYTATRSTTKSTSFSKSTSFTRTLTTSSSFTVSGSQSPSPGSQTSSHSNSGSPSMSGTKSLSATVSGSPASFTATHSCTKSTSVSPTPTVTSSLVVALPSHSSVVTAQTSAAASPAPTCVCSCSNQSCCVASANISSYCGTASNGLSPGAIAAVAVSCSLIGLGCVGALAFLYRRKHQFSTSCQSLWPLRKQPTAWKVDVRALSVDHAAKAMYAFGVHTGADDKKETSEKIGILGYFSKRRARAYGRKEVPSKISLVTATTPLFSRMKDGPTLPSPRSPRRNSWPVEALSSELAAAPRNLSPSPLRSLRIPSPPHAFQRSFPAQGLPVMSTLGDGLFDTSRQPEQPMVAPPVAPASPVATINIPHEVIERLGQLLLRGVSLPVHGVDEEEEEGYTRRRSPSPPPPLRAHALEDGGTVSTSSSLSSAPPAAVNVREPRLTRRQRRLRLNRKRRQSKASAVDPSQLNLLRDLIVTTAVSSLQQAALGSPHSRVNRKASRRRSRSTK